MRVLGIKDHNRSEQGYSLIEVLGSILIIGLLAGTIFSTYQVATKTNYVSQQGIQASYAMQWVADRLKSLNYTTLYGWYQDEYDDYQNGSLELDSLLGEAPPAEFQYSLTLNPVPTVDTSKMLEAIVVISKGEREIHKSVFYVSKGGF